MLKKVGFWALAAVLGLSGLLAVATSPVHAAAAPRVTHDMSHPVHLVYIPGSSGIGSTTTGDIQPTGNTTAHSGHLKYANFPSGCYNNVAYAQSENGATSWTQYSSPGDIEAVVWYYWCPTYYGDTVGQNFSYGRAIPIGVCATFYIGNSPGSFWYGGAALYDSSKNNRVADDGQYETTYSDVCSSNGNYVWDYSLPLSGASQYYGAMDADADVIIVGGSTMAEEAIAWTPKAQ